MQSAQLNVVVRNNTQRIKSSLVLEFWYFCIVASFSSTTLRLFECAIRLLLFYPNVIRFSSLSLSILSLGVDISQTDSFDCRYNGYSAHHCFLSRHLTCRSRFKLHNNNRVACMQQRPCCILADYKLIHFGSISQ